MVGKRSTFIRSLNVLQAVGPKAGNGQAMEPPTKRVFPGSTGNEAGSGNNIDDVVAIKDSMIQTLKQISEGYERIMLMYTVLFALGILLVVVAIGSYLWTKDVLLTGIFAGMSVLDVLTFFLSDPISKLKNSKCDQAQLEACIYSWFVDIYNWNDYLGKLDPKNGQDYDTVKKVSDAMYDCTEKTMKMIQTYTEDTKAAATSR